jgi:hypothetical protein
MAEARLTGAGEFYAKALSRLVTEYMNIKDDTERGYAAEQAKILSVLLGTEKYTPAAADLWSVVEKFSDPLVKAEAMMALGRIRAMTYLPQVIRVLESINADPAPPERRPYSESVAFGAIIALEKYQDPSGYLPVFFASTGWYSQRVQEQAKKSLLFIAGNVSSYMLEIIKGSTYGYADKYTALQTFEKSQTEAKDKAEVAAAALAEGWRGVASSGQGATTLTTMRLLALNMLSRNRTDDESVYQHLERSYKSGAMDEKLAAINALAFQRTDESARMLSDFLMVFIGMPRLTNDQLTIVRALIPALGRAGRPSGKTVLRAVDSAAWTTNALKTEASNASKAIDNNR